MNAERLLANMHPVADTPDAIPRLRRFILNLAVRGKLVEQNPHDEPASELRKHIAQAKLSQADLPINWHRTTVGTVLNFQYGKGLKASHRTNEGPVPVYGSNGIVGYTDEPLTRRPSVIVGRKGSAGTLNLCEGPSWTTDVAYYVEAPSFLALRFLHDTLAVLRLDKLGKGVKPGLSRSDAYEQIMCVPPVAEQRRIVAKVDELMALCDRLEAARTKRETTRDRLAAAILVRLNAPESDPSTFRNHTAFALEILTPLTTRPDQIKALRQTILNLAVRGKLVEQDTNDEAAEETLKKVRIERDDLVQRKYIRHEKPLDKIEVNEPPFEVPHKWCWTRIGEVALFTQYGTSTKSVSSEQGIPVLTMGNIQDGRVVFGNEKKIPDESAELPMVLLRKFDLLYNRTNSAELVGKTGIYLGEDNFRTFASYLIRIRLSQTSSSPRYVNLAMNAPVFRETQIAPLIKKQTGQANVNGTALKHMLLPLPPLAEQRRIVAQVDELIALCDRMEESLATVGDIRRRLLDSVLYYSLLADANRRKEYAE